jgi:hypothetical protein
MIKTSILAAALFAAAFSPTLATTKHAPPPKAPAQAAPQQSPEINVACDEAHRGAVTLDTMGFDELSVGTAPNGSLFGIWVDSTSKKMLLTVQKDGKLCIITPLDDSRFNPDTIRKVFDDALGLKV